MKIGDKFRRLECVDIEVNFTEIMAKDASGKEYPTGETLDESIYVFKCQCGGELRISTKLFELKGKRRTYDCGCGMGAEDGITVNMAFSLPISLRRLIQDFAAEQQTDISKAVRLMIETGYEVLKAKADGRKVF